MWDQDEFRVRRVWDEKVDGEIWDEKFFLVTDNLRLGAYPFGDQRKSERELALHQTAREVNSRI